MFLQSFIYPLTDLGGDNINNFGTNVFKRIKNKLFTRTVERNLEAQRIVHSYGLSRSDFLAEPVQNGQRNGRINRVSTIVSVWPSSYMLQQ